MRNRTLHDALRAFVEDAGAALAAETAAGAEIPFEVLEQGYGGSPLYCYRPLTGPFIAEREQMLARLPSAPAARGALVRVEGLGAFARRLDPAPTPADAVLATLLAAVFDESTDFALPPERFERAYAAIEDGLYEGRTLTSVLAPVFGLEIAGDAVPLADGLTLMHGDAPQLDAPPEAVRDEDGVPYVVLVLEKTEEPGRASPLGAARARFRRVLTALRLYDAAAPALGPVAWVRRDGSPWRPAPLAVAGWPRGRLRIEEDAEDELRAFCSLVSRRAPAAGELAWALARYEMACERRLPFEGLSDLLLALRALLEPEGPQSGRLPARLATLCAVPAERTALAERIAHAVSLERAVIAGLTPPDPYADPLVDELAGHTRALLSDVLCGHLDSDLRGVADRLLSEAAASV